MGFTSLNVLILLYSENDAFISFTLHEAKLICICIVNKTMIDFYCYGP